MKSFLYTLTLILTIFSTNIFPANALNIGSEISTEKVSRTYTPKPKKGMKWTYNMKAPFASGDYSSEILDVIGENIVIKATTPKKTTEKTVKVNDFSLIPQMKNSSKKVKLKYLGTENITLYGKNYKADKFIGDIDTPGGIAKTDFWYAENIGLLKMFSQAKFIGITISVNFELKDFSS